MIDIQPREKDLSGFKKPHFRIKTNKSRPPPPPPPVRQTLVCPPPIYVDLFFRISKILIFSNLFSHEIMSNTVYFTLDCEHFLFFHITKNLHCHLLLLSSLTPRAHSEPYPARAPNQRQIMCAASIISGIK